MSSPSTSKGGAAKFGALGLAAVALGCAALAAFLVQEMMRGNFSGEKVRPIVVAKGELNAASTLTPDNLELKDWPEASVPTGAFDSIDAVFAGGKAPILTVGVLAGEPVVASRLATTATGSGIASLVRPNMRAVALQVDDSIGYTGLVYPGAFVDVIVTIRDPLGRGPSSRIAVQNARVLTVGADTDVATRRVQRVEADRLTQTPTQGGTYVTLEVTPDEAEIISIARNEGKVDLALRNGNDDQAIETRGATPVAFSAFAPVVTTNPDGTTTVTQVDPAVPQPATAKAGDKGSSSSRSSSGSRRRIQLIANDEPDEAGPAKSIGAIETYHAN